MDGKNRDAQNWVKFKRIWHFIGAEIPPIFLLFTVILLSVSASKPIPIPIPINRPINRPINLPIELSVVHY